MEAFVKKLQGRLEKELTTVSFCENAVKGYDHRIRIVMQVINSLKEYIFEHPFPDQAAEIHYFKHVAPTFYSQHFYFVKLHDSELCRITSSPEDFRRFEENELQEIDLFFRNHCEFCKYFYSGGTFFDEKYFTRSTQEHSFDTLSAIIDENFCLASYRVSWILANEKYRSYLLQKLRGVDPAFNGQPNPAKWIGTVSEAVELIVAIQLSGLVQIDDQPATLEQIKERFEVFSGVEVKDVNGTDSANRRKKKESTPFLAKLTARYIARMNHLLGSS